MDRVDDQNYMTLGRPSSTTTDGEDSYGGFSRGDEPHSDTHISNQDFSRNHVGSVDDNQTPTTLAARQPIHGAIGDEDNPDAYETSATLNPDYVEQSPPKIRPERMMPEDTAMPSPIFSSVNNPQRKGPFRVFSGGMLLILGIAVVALYFAMKNNSSNNDPSNASTNTTAVASASGGVVGQMEILTGAVNTLTNLCKCPGNEKCGYAKQYLYPARRNCCFKRTDHYIERCSNESVLVIENTFS